MLTTVVRKLSQLIYDNTASRLAATNGQSAVDELAAAVVALGQTPTTPTPGTYLVSGGRLVYRGTGYQFTITAGTGYINGAAVAWTQQDVTLAAADPVDDRIDVFVVNGAGTVSAIAGKPAATPSKPDVDPAAQLELTFALVYANTTTPTGTAVTAL